MIDETLRASVLAPWGARVHEFDLQVGEYVIPKEVCNIIRFTVWLYAAIPVCFAINNALLTCYFQQCLDSRNDKLF